MTPKEHIPLRHPLSQARRVVIKVGSALLVDAASGNVRRAWLDTLAADVAALRARGQEVLLVSSGAIALGASSLASAAGGCDWRKSRPPPPSAKSASRMRGQKCWSSTS